MAQIDSNGSILNAIKLESESEILRYLQARMTNLHLVLTSKQSHEGAWSEMFQSQWDGPGVWMQVEYGSGGGATVIFSSVGTGLVLAGRPS